MPASKKQDRTTLLALLRDLRHEAGLQQVGLAKKLGRPQPFVSRIESGERKLDVLELRGFCDVFAVRPSEYFDRLESRLHDT